MLHTVKETAVILRSSEMTVYRWIRQKKLQALKTNGGKVLIDDKEIERFLNPPTNESRK